MLRAVAEIAPKKLANKFYEGSLWEVALFDQSASRAFPEIQFWTKPQEVVSQHQHCENFSTLSVEEEENLENVCHRWAAKTSPGGFTTNGVPLRRCNWICCTNFPMLLFCKDKVSILPYYVFRTINNPFHRFTFVRDIDFNQAKLWWTNFCTTKVIMAWVSRLLENPQEGAALQYALCNARDCNTVDILGDVLCSTVLFNKFWIECFKSFITN